MTYRVVVSRQANAEIVRNAMWWADNRSADQARRWRTAIYAKIYSLDALPASHARAVENGDFAYELRAALFGLGSRPTHRILFRIEGEEVRVLSVRSAAQDDVSPDEVEPFEPSA